MHEVIDMFISHTFDAKIVNNEDECNVVIKMGIQAGGEMDFNKSISCNSFFQ